MAAYYEREAQALHEKAEYYQQMAAQDRWRGGAYRMFYAPRYEAVARRPEELSALIAFGVDSLIEVISAVALLWRLLQTGPNATSEEHGHAERRALYLVSATFFLLAAFVTFESISALVTREAPESSTVGLVLSVLSLIIMPVLAYTKQQTGRELGSKALQADAVETWVCSYLSFTLLAGVGLNFAFGWWWADAVGALMMLPVILWQGRETFEEAREAGEESGG